MIGAIKRRWKSNKKCTDKDKEKVTPLPSFPVPASSSRKGTVTAPLSLPPVDFIHVNSGRIELHPGLGAEKEKDLLWGQHLHYETRHSWCGPQQLGPLDLKKKDKDQQQTPSRIAEQEYALLLQRLASLEEKVKEAKGVDGKKSSLEGIVAELKEDFTHSMGRQEKLAKELEDLHLRVNSLETHNKALANIILPTLLRLTKENQSQPKPGPTLLENMRTPTPRKLQNTNTFNSSNNNASSSTSSTSPIPSSKELLSTKVVRSQSPIKGKGKLAKMPIKDVVIANRATAATVTAAKSSIPSPTRKTVAKEVPQKPLQDCRIPAMRMKSTTHPPKSSPSTSSGCNKDKTTSLNKEKPSVLVKENASVSAPSSPSKLPMRKSKLPVFQKKLNGMLQQIPPRPSCPLSLLTPKDEGYSTMSNGAIDSTEPTSSNNIINSNTFTRPKPKEKQPKLLTSPIKIDSGTWTKKKAPKLEEFTLGEMKTFSISPASITVTEGAGNVKIVKGIAKEVKSSDDEKESSGNCRVLLEDCEDADILYLPIEVSSTSGSEGTLVPYPYSRSTSATNTNSTITSDSTYYTAPETSEETSTGTDTNWSSADEHDLVQRWMRLEDMRRNEEEPPWQWDWDGLVRNTNRNNNPSSSEEQEPVESESDDDFWAKFRPSNPTKRDRRSPQNLHFSPSKDGAIYGRRTSPSSSPKKIAVGANGLSSPKRILQFQQEQELPLRLEVYREEEDGQGSQEIVEEKPKITESDLNFTAEFYRLTSSGTEDKIIQTEEDSLKFLEGIDENLEQTKSQSDLFQQCQNCLEKMSKLISLHQSEENEALKEGHCVEPDFEESLTDQVARLLKIRQAKEGSPSKWINVGLRPRQQGVPTLHSSSDSEDPLSPNH